MATFIYHLYAFCYLSRCPTGHWLPNFWVMLPDISWKPWGNQILYPALCSFMWMKVEQGELELPGIDLGQRSEAPCRWQTILCHFIWNVANVRFSQEIRVWKSLEIFWSKVHSLREGMSILEKHTHLQLGSVSQPWQAAWWGLKPIYVSRQQHFQPQFEFWPSCNRREFVPGERVRWVNH